MMATFEAEYGEDIDIPYKLIISILCQCYTGHAAAAAEQILHYYESKALAGANYSDLATTETYNGLITSWVKADQSRYPHAYNPPYRHSAHPPANILSEMISLYKQNPHQFYRIRPDAISFNMTITSLSNHKKREQAVASEQYLREVKDLAFHILQSMIETYKKENVHCAPDRVVFETVLNILHARPPANDDADRACELLDEMLDLYSSEAYPHDVKPSTLDFNMVLGLMADQRQVNTATVEKAKRYLTKMEELAEHEEPDVTDGDDYLDSFSADPLLQEYQSSKSNSKPDTVTYNSLIKIACNARMPETAQDILNDMIDIANSGDDSVKPDVLSFNTVSCVLYLITTARLTPCSPLNCIVIQT
jgi:pentatricopeptide repeat protein